MHALGHGLSSQLQIPLSYLLYQARLRFKKDLRGLTVAQPPADPAREFASEHRIMEGAYSGRSEYSTKRGGPSRMASSHMSMRARLHLLSQSLPKQPSRAPESSTLTFQQRRLSANQDERSVISGDSESDSDQDSARANEGERLREEADALDRKLKELQGTINNGVLALVRQEKIDTKGKLRDRGRNGTISGGTPPFTRVSAKSASIRSRSSTTSPQGSIPSIPSPPIDSLSQSPVSRHLSPVKKSSSPPVLSTGNARGHSHMQYRSSVGHSMASAQSSAQNSSASSFSDLSGQIFIQIY